jgi:glycosyltransferase involved in cell wall biosynthesis
LNILNNGNHSKEPMAVVETPITEDAVSPMKVCMHLAHRARTDFRVMRDAKALVEAGFEVTIVDFEEDLLRSAWEEIDGVYLKHIIMPSWFVSTRFKPWFLMKAAVMFMHGVILLLRTEADIYHAHVEFALPACYLGARLRGKPLIFDVPDLTLSDPSIMRWRKLRALAIRFLAHMVPHCATVITASPYYASELRTLYRASDVTVVRNMPAYRSVPRSDRLRHYLGLGPETRIALYQGNIQANRGLDRLVCAAKFLNPNIVIVMMGWAIEPTCSQLEELIVKEQVTDRVKLLPAVPYPELLDWTASADIGLAIFPPEYSLSIRYTLPNKFFEYMMAGKPVLSSQLDAIAEVIEICGVGKIVPSLTPSDLAAAINAMLEDTCALARMRSNALEIAQREFCWEEESQKLIHLYKKLLGKTDMEEKEQSVLLR